MKFRVALTMSLCLIPFAAIQAAPTVTVQPIPKAVRAIHDRALTIDTHLDTPAYFHRPDWNLGDRHSLKTDPSQVDIPRMIEAGLDGGFFVIYTPQQPRTAAGRQFARDRAIRTATLIREQVMRNRDKIELAFSADDALRIAKTGKRFAFQSMENSDPLSSDITLLKTFYDFGVRMVGPVHFANNDFADSSTDPKGKEWNGLSPLGRQLIADANRMGMLLDASHASDDVLDQMLALSKAPIILSHSGCKAIYDHPRNIDDTRLKALAAKGGVIQINAFPDYVARVIPNPERTAAMTVLFGKYGPRDTWNAAQTAAFIAERDAVFAKFPQARPTFDDFMKHLLHALEVVGPDHVGIGPDWDGGGGVAGLEDITGNPQITARLVAAGLSEADIDKIWGGNVIRLLRGVETEARKEQAAIASASVLPTPATPAPAPAPAAKPAN